MKILNLFAGIGGNRANWVLDGLEITSVEEHPLIADVYKTRFPADEVIIGDAIEYLEKHYKDYDFIWASPPCQTHGQVRHHLAVQGHGSAPLVPDMTSLYGTIAFLQKYSEAAWIVENTKPWREALIQPTQHLGRHLIWSNFFIPYAKIDEPGHIKNLKTMKPSEFPAYNLLKDRKMPGLDKRQILRNQVNPTLALHILQAANEWFGGAI